MKIRSNLYLDRDVSEALDALARKPGGNKSRIANDLLKGAIAHRASAALGDALKPRLDRMTRDIRSGNRVANVLLEALMLFMRYLFAAVPPVAESDAAAAAAGALRFERFIDELGRELAKGGILASSLADGESAR